ncbi:MAG: adenylate/guanylate cyclase domain-containing protein [Elusimicrobiota bacterium]
MNSSDTRVLTIMRTDIKDFTKKTNQISRAALLSLLEKQKQIVLPVLQSRGGKLINTIGEAYLLVFDSPTNAVLGAAAAQDALARYNSYRPEAERIEIRIAVNMGEIHLTDGDIFGEPVSITAQLGNLAAPGEVFFTEAVYLSMSKAEVACAEVDPLQLKGVAKMTKVYKVSPHGG